MGTLYIDRKDLYIKLDGEALAFYANGNREGIVPISPLKRVIMIGNINLETSVLNKLSTNQKSVLFLSGKRLKFHGILHGRLHNNGALRVKQYEKSLTKFCSDLAKELIKRKIDNQKQLLSDVRDKRSALRRSLTPAINTLEKISKNILETDIDLDRLRGMEGGASASYFSAYIMMFPASLSFKCRNRRPPRDPVNAMLSLCYTLLHFEFVREIEVIGLDPTIGFYHQFDYGRESLACDLVEPYRPFVDKFLWNTFKERVFSNRDFANDDERPGCYLKKNSRKRFYPLYEEWAKDIRPQIVDEVRTLANRIMDGKDALS